MTRLFRSPAPGLAGYAALAFFAAAYLAVLVIVVNPDLAGGAAPPAVTTH